MRSLRLAAVAVLTATALVSAAGAGSPGTWTRATDPGGRNIDEVGLARTGDGVLHVVWPKQTSTEGGILHRPISRSGGLGNAIAATGSWDAVDNPDLVVLPNGSLRLFFGGLGSTFAQGGIQSATAPASGASWTASGQPSLRERGRRWTRRRDGSGGRHADLHVGFGHESLCPRRPELRQSRPRRGAIPALLLLPPERGARPRERSGRHRLPFPRRRARRGSSSRRSDRRWGRGGWFRHR